MTPYSQTRIKQIVDCLTNCWYDIYEICRDWEDATLESLSEAQRAAADIAYSTCELNHNARQLYNLAKTLDLKIEVQRGEYSVETMDDCLGEIERIEGKIDGWFEQAQSSNDVPVNSYLANDVRHYIRSAIFNVKYLIKPLIGGYRKQKNIERIKQQLSYHPDCRTVIEPTKKAIEAELEKLFFSQTEAHNLLERHLADAQNQFEECLHWRFVAEATLEDIAEHILPFALVGDQLELGGPVSSIMSDYSRAYAWGEFMNWLRKQQREYAIEGHLVEEGTTKLPSSSKTKPTQTSLAMFYFYCHQAGCLPQFTSGALKQAYSEAVQPYQLSAKSFQQHYNRAKEIKFRLAESNRKSLLQAINMLHEYPTALRIANDELKVAERRTSLK